MAHHGQAQLMPAAPAPSLLPPRFPKQTNPTAETHEPTRSLLELFNCPASDPPLPGVCSQTKRSQEPKVTPELNPDGMLTPPQKRIRRLTLTFLAASPGDILMT